MKSLLLPVALVLSLSAAAQTRTVKPAAKPASKPAAAKPKTAKPAADAEATTKELNTALCDCFTKKEPLEFKSEQEAGMMFGQCMSEDPKAGALFLQLIQAKGVAMDDQAAMEAVGRETGTKLAASCPAFFQAMLRFQTRRQSDSAAKP